LTTSTTWLEDDDVEWRLLVFDDEDLINPDVIWTGCGSMEKANDEGRCSKATRMAGQFRQRRRLVDVMLEFILRIDVENVVRKEGE